MSEAITDCLDGSRNSHKHVVVDEMPQQESDREQGCLHLTHPISKPIEDIRGNHQDIQGLASLDIVWIQIWLDRDSIA